MYWLKFRQKYELPTWSWADKHRKRLTNDGRDKIRQMIADKLNKTSLVFLRLY